MGTLLAATIAPDDARHLHAVFGIAKACEQLMSRHQPNSAVSQLNRVAGLSGWVLSPDLACVLFRARELAQATDGAFDPTLGAVLDVWRRASRRGSPPARGELHAALEAVDWRAIQINGPRVALRRSGMAVDLGAFGKGVALDLVGDTLRREGCRAALLNFGESSLVAIGRPPRGRWRVTLRHPGGGFVGDFPLGTRACSTSATSGQTRRVGRVRVSHIVDPQTGRPIRRMAQVTVLARSAALAEAASTALIVLGRSAMEEMAQRLGLDACWVDYSGISTTPWFPLRRLG